MSEAKYNRVLLKLSGEALAGEDKTGINIKVVGEICDKIKEVVEMGVQVAIVERSRRNGSSSCNCCWRRKLLERQKKWRTNGKDNS